MEYYQTSDKKLFYVPDLAHNHARNLKDKTVNKVNSKDLKAEQKQKSNEIKPKQNTSKQGKEKPVVEAIEKADVSKENVEANDNQESTDSKEATKQGKEKSVVETDAKTNVSKENVETKDNQESTDSKEATENVDTQSTEDSKTKD